MFAYTFILKIRADPNSIFQKIDNIIYTIYESCEQFDQQSNILRTYVRMCIYGITSILDLIHKL